MSTGSITRRYLAVVFTHLPTDRLRRKPSGAFCALPDEQPLVVAEKIANSLVLVATDRAAQSLGLFPGLALADARARVPEVVVAEADRRADRTALERIADWCDRYTPFVAASAPDCLVLDVTGCAHLLGGEAAMLGDVTARIRGFGFRVKVAMAGTAQAAEAVARFGRPGVVPDGGDAEAVRYLPVAALGIEPSTVVALARAGLRSIGDLAARPRAPLAARFGDGLIARLERTLGAQNAPISPRRVLAACQCERAFSDPVVRLEDVTETVRRLALDLSPLLEARDAGGRVFEARLFRVDGRVRQIRIVTARPTRDPAVIARLYSQRLEIVADQLDAGFGFELIRLTALVTEPIQPSQTQLDPAEDDHARDDAISGLIENLSIRLGRERVSRLETVETHNPDRATRKVPALLAGHGFDSGDRQSCPAGGPPVRPIGLFDPPQPIEAVAAVPDSPPMRFRWRRVLHDVVRAEGPERIASEWWRGDVSAFTRDYYRVEDREGRRFWIFREGLYERETNEPRWFLHGVFA
jgi:protein ImuB